MQEYPPNQPSQPFPNYPQYPQPPQGWQPGQYPPPIQQPQSRARLDADTINYYWARPKARTLMVVAVALILVCMCGGLISVASGAAAASRAMTQQQTNQPQPTAIATATTAPVRGYLVADSSGAIFISYHATDATHYIGMVRLAYVKDGKVAQVSASITGVASGKTITFTADSSTDLKLIVRLSGANLTCTVQTSDSRTTVTMHPATEIDYTTAVNALTP